MEDIQWFCNCGHKGTELAVRDHAAIFRHNFYATENLRFVSLSLTSACVSGIGHTGELHSWSHLSFCEVDGCPDPVLEDPDENEPPWLHMQAHRVRGESPPHGWP
jgi:hypothetical protein